MDAVSEQLFTKLETNIKSIVKVYRALLEVVRKEKEILIEADLSELNDNNVSKEKLLVKVGRIENERVQIAKELSKAIGLKAEEPRLLEIAKELQGEYADRLRNLHSVLHLLLKRVKEVNDQNEILVQSALANVTGAMTSIKEDLVDQETFDQKANIQKQSTLSGRLVNREA